MIKPSKTQPDQDNSPKKTSFQLTLSGLLTPLPITVVFLIEALIFKALQTTAVLEGFVFGPFILAALPDMAFAILFALPFAVGFSLLSGKARIALSAVFHLISLVILVLYAGSHGYFQATGANLSLSPIEYLIVNAQSSSGVVSSEASVDRLVLLFSQPLFVIISAILIHVPWFKRRIDKRPPFSRKRSLTIVGTTAAVGLILHLVPRPQGPAASLARSIPGAIAWELVTDKLVASDDVDLTDDEQFGTDLALKKKPGAPTPNIVYILFESLSWKHSDVYFPGKNTTPFLAKLAKDAVVIDRMYTTVPHTTKAIMSALCGLYPYFETTPKEATPGILPRRCLAHMLASQGYETAFFQPAYNFEHRDDLVYNMGYHQYRGLKDMPRKGFESMSYFGAEDKMMIGPSMDWVASVKDDGPFFLTYMTLATHHNYAVPQSFPYIDYDVEDNDLRNYLNAVRYIDSFIEEVFDEFEKMGLMDDTVFIITGDHGEGFFEHQRRQHDLVIFEEGLRVASLIYGPKFLGEHRRIEGVRSNLDWVPTVADLLGLELTEGSFVGSSLLKPVPTDRKLFHSCWFRRQCMAMHEGETKSIYFYGLRPMEAYDNAKDPFDENNLAFEAPYDSAFLDQRKAEMTRFKRVVDQQFETWEADLSSGKIVTKKPHVTKPIAATFGDAIALVGVDIPGRTVKPGASINVRYVFKCLEKPKRGDSLFVHVLHEGDFINADHVPVSGTYPPEEWQPGEYIIDEHKVHIPKNWRGDNVRLAVGFWNKQDKKRLKVESDDADVDSNRVVVATLPLKAGGSRLPSRSRFSIEKLREKIKDHLSFEPVVAQKPIGAVFGDKVELVGFNPDRMDVELAGTVEMTYIFKALESVPRSWRLSVRLIRDDGREVKGDHIPLNGLYPMTHWQEGEYVSDKHMIHIDMYRTRIGTYKAYLGFKSAGGKPVPVTVKGSAEVDDEGRVYLGDVIIRKDHDPHLRR